jgi:hypothetical protein
MPDNKTILSDSAVETHGAGLGSPSHVRHGNQYSPATKPMKPRVVKPVLPYSANRRLSDVNKHGQMGFDAAMVCIKRIPGYDLPYRPFHEPTPYEYYDPDAPRTEGL